MGVERERKILENKIYKLATVVHVEILIKIILVNFFCVLKKSYGFKFVLPSGTATGAILLRMRTEVSVVIVYRNASEKVYRPNFNLFFTPGSLFRVNLTSGLNHDSDRYMLLEFLL